MPSLLRNKLKPWPGPFQALSSLSFAEPAICRRWSARMRYRDGWRNLSGSWGETFRGARASTSMAAALAVSAVVDVLPYLGSGIAAKQYDPGAPFFGRRRR